MPVEKLDLLVELTEQMLVFALQNAWDELAVVQVGQEQLLRECLGNIVYCAEPERLILERVKILVDHVIQLAETGKAEIAEEIHAIKQSRLVHQAYAQNVAE